MTLAEEPGVPGVRMKVVTGEKMREMDNRAMEEYGIPGIVLMENAGLRVVEEIIKRYSLQNLRVIIACGRGNNGGDGFVIARHLINKGIRTEVYALAREEDYRGDALANYLILKNMGIKIKYMLEEKDLDILEIDLSHATLLVDALLGTGLSSEVKGLPGEVINRINLSSVPVISVDIPSGVQADTGQILGRGVKAQQTVTFALPKQGLFLYPGAALAGEVTVGDISMPREVMEDEEVKVNLVTMSFVQECLPLRPACSHKGTYGRIFLVGGSPGLTGAVALAGEAALKSGSGLVTVGIPRSLNPILEVKLTEVMTLPLPEDEENFLAEEGLDQVLEQLGQCDAGGFGPGVYPRRSAQSLLEGIIKNAPVPLVIDAGGLALLAKNMKILREASAPLVLTPHPGEMARLMNTSSQEVEKNRLSVARDFARAWQVVLVLKGAHTIVALPSEEIYINTTGNPGMASGGTGDVLTGIIAGLIGQGLSPEEAAVAGTYLHGLAGDMAVSDQGEAGLTALDLLYCLPGALKTVYQTEGEV
ncbi:MAG: NAD(P)H-hydrate dehydratase [Candidatus Syntrophonatronum acetioxidans]|uniref:Bifunctional NAD(P)H-hydrate repair enzyme n=1 Tax=Candidatus Syntrophonatronum acetioxidans TaxID=1795816 RepID=A0A424YF63_9FIRM|nr:MAG: NAD(P)H-hydrate dehydratase [Candidatus Syntrophonatronum acetioxidans]